MMIVNEDSRVINQLETSLTDDARVIIYDHHMFIVQPPGLIIRYQTWLAKIKKLSLIVRNVGDNESGDKTLTPGR
jgi:hypothetical protein